MTKLPLADKIFVILLFLVPFFAFFAPESLTIDQAFDKGIVDILAAGIFFLHGLATPLGFAKKYIGSKKILLLFFLWILFCPISALIVQHLFSMLHPDLESYKTGVFLLALLPTTVASSIALTKIATGREGFSLFISLSSNFLTLLVLPVGMSFAIEGKSIDPPSLHAFYKLFVIAGVPFFTGSFLKKAFHLQKLPKWTVFFRHGALLTILYVSFCESKETTTGIFSLSSTFLMLTAELILLHILWFAGAFMLAKLLSYKDDDKVAILFAIPQKSIILGIPYALALVGSTPILSDQFGFLAPPLLIYNLIQWIGALILLHYAIPHNTRRWSRKKFLD